MTRMSREEMPWIQSFEFFVQQQSGLLPISSHAPRAAIPSAWATSRSSIPKVFQFDHLDQARIQSAEFLQGLINANDLFFCTGPGSGYRSMAAICAAFPPRRSASRGTRKIHDNRTA